jgi:tetratricopeptide (TPR) repeat protein
MSKKKDSHKSKQQKGKPQQTKVKSTQKGKLKPIQKKKAFEKNEIRWLVIILLLTIFAFVPGLQGELLSFDDQAYISENPLIQKFTFENIGAIFSQFHYGGYYPLTLFSFMIDYQIAELNPFIYHFTNLLLHLVNTLLVFFLIKKLFKNKVISLTAAFLFGIHSLHVESVTWATERKDVLYAFFYLLSLLNYLKYIDKKDRKYFIYTFVFFSLSVLSKSMAIVLAPTLLLFDYFKGRKLTDNVVLIEKVPFFILSIAFGIIAIKSQASIGAITDEINLPFTQRIAFAAYSFTLYIIKLFIPFGQTAFYPYPEFSGVYWLFVIPGLGFIYLTYKFLKENKTLAFAMIFFLIHIVLGLQLMQVNDFLMADRFAYLASIGVFIVIGYFYKNYLEKKNINKNILYGIAGVYIVFLFISTTEYVKKWESSLILWDHIVKKNPDKIPKAYYWRGHTYVENGDYSLALKDFSKVINMDGHDYLASAYHSRAVTYANMNNLNLALEDIENGIKADSSYMNFYVLRGQIYAGQKKLELAEKDFNTVVSLDTNNYLGYYHRADFYRRAGELEKSLDDFSKILILQPDFADAYYYRANILIQLKRNDEACGDLQKAYQLGLEEAKSAMRQYCH